MLKFLKNFSMKNVLQIFLFTVFLLGIASAQIPDKFKNLKVLSKDIAKKELIGKMKGFTRALGVRCNYCHVAEDPKDLKTYDFASDEKTHKQKARIMMKMVQAINKDHLSKLSEYSDNILEVKCMTCHHGQNEPKLLEDILIKVVEKKGLEAGINKYKKLKEQFYGGFTYDFQVSTLATLTENLIKAEKFDEALAFSKINAETYPNSLLSLYYLGEANVAKGNKEEAIEAYTKAMKFAPGNPQLIKKIENLKNKK